MLRQRITDDEALEKPFNKEQFKRLMSYMKPYKKQLLITLVLMIMAAVCGLLGPLILQLAIDKYMFKEKLAGLLLITLAYLGVNLISMLCVRTRVRIMVVVGQEVLFQTPPGSVQPYSKAVIYLYDSRPAERYLSV